MTDTWGRYHRFILIDPEARTIEPVTGTERDMSRIVGTSTTDSFALAAHTVPLQRDYGLVDDEGLTRGAPIHAFKLTIRDDPIAGRCLVYGAGERGETCDAATPVEFLADHIEWLGLIVPRVEWRETKYGMRAKVTWRAA